jgi:hypothetical protein
MAQDNVNQRGPVRANVPPAAACLMPQTQSMIFDLEKFLVERDEMRRVHFARGGELALRVLQNFILLMRHSLG